MKIEKEDLKYILPGVGLLIAIFSIPNVQLQLLFSMSFVFILTIYIMSIELKKYDVRISKIEEKTKIGGKENV